MYILDGDGAGPATSPGRQSDSRSGPRLTGEQGWKSDPSADFDAWLKDLKAWRHEQLIRMGYNDAQYRRPELQWAQRNFIQPQMMVEERYFYDPVAGKYTVDRYLDDLEKRYGGIDSVLIWPVYPNIGIDNRNQCDLHRDMPGGVPRLRQMVDDFHRRGVRVFFPMMPWDKGTRDRGHALLGSDREADGRDRRGRRQRRHVRWRAARLPNGVGRDRASPGVRAGRRAGRARGLDLEQPELGHIGSFGFVPTVSTLKWLEPRHMVNVCDRWARDKTDDLQYAFFNGVGYESWENIWGIWNGITPRDAEAMRRVAHIERKFAPFLVSPDWEPHTPVLQHGVYASKFPARR